MIERLVEVLRALAGPGDVDPARAERLAGDFDDAARLVIDCPQIELTGAQRAALDRLAAHLDRAPGGGGAAGRDDARRLAREALAALGDPHVPM